MAGKAINPSKPPYPDIWVGEKACSWLREKGKCEQPWFLWVSFPGPHEPWDTPHPWAGMHQRSSYASITRPDWICRQPLLSECRQRELVEECTEQRSNCYITSRLRRSSGAVR